MENGFLKKYHLMYDFLGGWFPDADFEDKSDKQVVDEYKEVMLDSQLITLKAEFDELLEKKDTDHKYLSDLSNIYLENDSRMYEWLHELYGHLFEDE